MRADALLLAGAAVAAFVVVAVGGVFHPATLAGAVARFVFSLQ